MIATGQILKKTGRNCEGADFSWLSSKVSRTPASSHGRDDKLKKKKIKAARGSSVAADPIAK